MMGWAQHRRVASFIRQVRSLGWVGAVALGGLILALAVGLIAQHWDRQTAQLQAEADTFRMQIRHQRAARLAPAPASAAPATAAQWRAALPAADQRQQRLADLLEIGLRLGLLSQRTEHRLTVDTAAGLERLRVTMPVAGGYAQVRQYIAAALQHDPALSLDGLKLRRPTPLAPEVEAELQWSLHARSDGSPP
ncbi:hypothetical protein [Roseateles koreensis]|uniref:Type II secretion system (T2SS), protein M subtype b n=1 Tax=Roseateles koreensis TaxID=2987526 RepID=A0ABT5KS90_9BURK|nr:hypothetical protein [Roseateles koreensis]MDC8785701.1 hypothetical protein [Roseateles koreensis]